MKINTKPGVLGGSHFRNKGFQLTHWLPACAGCKVLAVKSYDLCFTSDHVTTFEQKNHSFSQTSATGGKDCCNDGQIRVLTKLTELEINTYIIICFKMSEKLGVLRMDHVSYGEP